MTADHVPHNTDYGYGLRGTLVERGMEPHHVCGPGWVLAPEGHPARYYWREPWDVPIGTVVRCPDCPQTWVCYLKPRAEGRNFVAFPYRSWRKETPRERRRREGKPSLFGRLFTRVHTDSYGDAPRDPKNGL